MSFFFILFGEAYEGEILVPAKDSDDAELFPCLELLRFSVRVLPMPSFQKKAMQNLERLELWFRMLEGVYDLENLEGLQQVLLRVKPSGP